MTAKAVLRQVEHRLGSLTKAVSQLRRQILAERGERAAVSTKSLGDLAAYLALTPAFSDDAILQNLLRCAMHAVDSGGAGLALFDAPSRRLVFRAAIGDGAKGLLGQKVPLKGSQHGLAFATGEVQSATPIYRGVERAARARFRNVLVAPLIVETEPVGTISAVNKRGADHFSPEDMSAFTLFADLAALIVRQRTREEILRRGLAMAARVPKNLSRVQASEERELLGLFADLAESMRTRPELVTLVRKLTEHF